METWLSLLTHEQRNMLKVLWDSGQSSRLLEVYSGLKSFNWTYSYDASKLSILGQSLIKIFLLAPSITAPQLLKI
jgi:hypothetical protein